MKVVPVLCISALVCAASVAAHVPRENASSYEVVSEAREKDQSVVSRSASSAAQRKYEKRRYLQENNTFLEDLLSFLSDILSLLICQTLGAFLGFPCDTSTPPPNTPPSQCEPDDEATSQPSLWEAHVQPFVTGTIVLQDPCYPRFTRQSALPKAAGLIVAFHGYSACPDQFDEISAAWLEAGFDVMVPLFPGHGRLQGECADNELGTFTGTCAGKDRFVDEIPSNRQAYVDFVDRINAIVIQEQCRMEYDQVIATGVSHGGTLATYAVNTAPSDLYDKFFAIVPSFAATSPGIDRQFVACVNSGTSNCIVALAFDLILDLLGGGEEDAGGGITESVLDIDGSVSETIATVQSSAFDGISQQDKYSIVQFALRKALTTVVEKLKQLPNLLQNLVTTTVYSWGDQCEVERANGRGGFCSYTVDQVLAVHSFGQLALRTMGLESSSQPREWQIVSTERDSVTRNTLMFQAGLSLPNGNLCMYRTVCDVEDDNGNECGVPHSMLARSEQELQSPFELYWMERLIQGSLDFFETGEPYGEFTNNNSDRNICQRLVLSSTEPSFDLALPANRGLWLTFDSKNLWPIRLLGIGRQVQVAASIAETAGLELWQVHIVDLEMDVAADVLRLYLELPATTSPNALRRIENAADRGELDEVAGAPLVDIEIANMFE